MKTVLFVPGFQEDIDSRDYRATIKAMEDKGYKVVFVPINWNRTTIEDWAKEVTNVYARYDQKLTILAGFSYGAMTSFMVASKQAPAGLWLFSLSPYFKEDIPHLKGSWLRLIGKRRVESFSRISFDEHASKINCKTFIFVGEKEIAKNQIVGQRAESAAESIMDPQLIRVPLAGHDVTAEPYLKAIHETI